MKHYFALAALMVLPAMTANAGVVTLDTQGQVLYGQLTDAIKANHCDSVIAYGYEFSQNYQPFLDANPEIKKATESSISGCVEGMLIKNRPLEPEDNSDLGIAEPQAEAAK